MECASELCMSLTLLFCLYENIFSQYWKLCPTDPKELLSLWTFYIPYTSAVFRLKSLKLLNSHSWIIWILFFFQSINIVPTFKVNLWHTFPSSWYIVFCAFKLCEIFVMTLDISKAFNWVWHALLLCKLLSFFLSNRSISVLDVFMEQFLPPSLLIVVFRILLYSYFH